MLKQYYKGHPFFNTGATQRLHDEYDKYGKLIVGFDFDNTIFDYHNCGGDFRCVILLLQKCKALGFTLCLFTADSNPSKLQWKVDFCKHYGIEPEYINESPVLRENKKPYFNILLDDRAGLESAFYTLLDVVNYANSKSDKH